jgi:MFS family permease
VLLPAYLLALGLGEFEVGLLATATLAGSAVATLTVGAFGHRAAPRTLLLAAALLMTATGFGFAAGLAFVPLLVVAFVGTLNPGAADVSVFLPIEHARLAASAPSAAARTRLFARYSLAGALAAAVGSLAAGLPDWVAAQWGVPRRDALRGVFVAYAVAGLAIGWLYRRRRASPPAWRRRGRRRSASRDRSWSSSPRCSRSMPSPADWC